MLHTTKLLSFARFSRVASNCLSLAFLLFLFALLSPVTPELSSAAPTSALSDQAAVEFSASVVPAVSVAVESSVNLDVAPSSTGSFATTPTTVTVSTNSREGYSLFLEAVGETNALLPQLNKDNPATIASLDTNTTEANFPINHWGVNLSGSSDYQPIPIDATDAIVSSSTANATDTYTLNFAVKIDDTLPVDTYSGSVLLSAVANPVTAHNLMELVYMQNMTHEICENTADYVDVDHYVTKQLIDTRDGKSYWVAKLADGNCWMVQNLGLVFKNSSTGIIAATADGSDGAKLTSDNTDITAASWAPIEASRTSPTTASGTQAIAWSINTNNDKFGTQQYYTWNAATAGSGSGLAGSGSGLAANAVTTDSICPKGWKLPLSGTSNNATSGSFYNLLNAYGLATKVASVAGDYVVYQPNDNTVTYTITAGQYNITSEPLNFILSGSVRNGGGQDVAGTVGYYWSSVVQNSSNAYFLSFSSSDVNSLNYNAYSFGFAIRCVSR